MPTYKQLPEIFGVTDGSIPFRIYVYAADFLNDGRFQKVEACPMSPDNNAIVVQASPPSGPFSWDIRAGLATGRVVYWDTGYKIPSDNRLFPEIPIYDFMEKSFLFQNIYGRGFPLHRVSNLQAAEIHRVNRDTRNAMYNAFDFPGNIQIQPQPSAPPASPPEPVIPTHVLTALVRSAVADGKSCPISLVDFEDTKEFGVTTTCFHIFEKESIEKWISTNKTCPECRKPCTNVVYLKN